MRPPMWGAVEGTPTPMTSPKSYALFAGGERGYACADQLLARDLAPTVVVAHDSSFLESAPALLRSGAETVVARGSDPGLPSLLARHDVALIVCVGYSSILSERLLSVASLGGVNAHAGRLPYYRGAAPIPWQIINGETEGTCSVLRMTSGIDDGPVLAAEAYPIGESETSRHVSARVNEIFSKILPSVVERILSGTPVEELPQPPGKPTRYTRRYPRDGRIVWTQRVQAITRLVRALDDPYPGAFFECEGRLVRVRHAVPAEEHILGVPGRIVGCSEGSLLILGHDGAVAVSGLEIDGQHVEPTDALFSYGTDVI